MMLQSIVLGLIESVSPCALSILLFLLGFLFLTALRKNIIKNAISFIVALFVILFVFDAALIRLDLFSLAVAGLIGKKILALALGVYGIVYFFFYDKEIFTKIDRYILSFPVAILFAILLFAPFILCSAGMIMIVIRKGTLLGSVFLPCFLYRLGFIIPLVIISLIVYAFGAKNEEAINRIRFLRLIGGIILIFIFLIL